MYHYTYHLYNNVTNQHYYGVRSCKDEPKNDLFISYFSSCKTVRELIAQHGEESFKVTVRKIFSSRVKAMTWEEKVLRRLKVIKRKDWLNNNIGGKQFGSYGLTQSDRAKQLKSIAAKQNWEKGCYNAQHLRDIAKERIGKPGLFKGKKHSSETINKMIEAKGTSFTFEGKEYKSFAQARRETGRSKTYIKNRIYGS